MSVCPGGPPVPNEPTTVTPGITVTPNLPQPIYSTNGSGNPIVSWNPTDEFCTLQFTATPGNEFIVPSTQWEVTWKNPDLTTGNDAGANPALAAAFGVAPGSGTPVTGPASSGPIVIGTNTLTATIVSGTIRVSMPNGSLFGYEPGDPVSNAVIKYQWANPVTDLAQLYFDNGNNQTPRGLTNYQTALAVAASIETAQCDPATSITNTSATLNGTVGGIQAGDTYEFHWGTTLGGPYPNVVGPNPAANGPVAAPIAGLSASTPYFFVVIVKDSGAVVKATSGECTFTTTAVVPPGETATCSSATAITSNSAILNGTLTNTPVGDTYEFQYGTAPGGPYPNTLGPFPVSGASPQNVSNPVGGLLPSTNYYYVLVARNAATAIVATSGECTFATAAVVPPPPPASLLPLGSPPGDGDGDDVGAASCPTHDLFANATCAGQFCTNGMLLEAFPAKPLETHFRNGYTYRGNPCTSVFSYDPNFCVPGVAKMAPQGYGPNRNAVVGMVQSAFKCSSVGATMDELRNEATATIEHNLWRSIETTLVGELVAFPATLQTPVAVEAHCALAEAAQFLANNSRCGRGIIAGPYDWFIQLDSDFLNFNGTYHTDHVGNVIIPLVGTIDTVYAFDSNVDIRATDIELLDEIAPGIQRNNDRVVRAEQVYTVAVDPCVVGSFTVSACCGCPTGGGGGGGGSVVVTNFPANQNVTVTNFPPFPANQTVTVSNFPAPDVDDPLVSLVNVSSHQFDVIPGTPWTPAAIPAGRLVGLSHTVVTGTVTTIDADGTTIAGIPQGFTQQWNVQDDRSTLTPVQSITADPASRTIVTMVVATP